MKKYEVKLSYPTILKVKDDEYTLFPDTFVELPDDEVVDVYVQMGYLKLVEQEKKGGKKDAG